LPGALGALRLALICEAISLALFGGTTEDPCRHAVGGVGLHGPGDVGVDLAGDVGAAVVEAVADDVDVDAFLEGEGGPGVAEAVELEAGERFVGVGLVVGLLLAAELAAEALGVVLFVPRIRRWLGPGSMEGARVTAAGVVAR
jgi:hypothetical protein